MKLMECAANAELHKTYKKETYLQNNPICRQVSSFANVIPHSYETEPDALHQYVDPVMQHLSNSVDPLEM